MTEPQTQTLQAPGATITYDVRRNETSNKTPLFIIGSPMGAAGFVTLAGHFGDRTVITYDPRGMDRSTKAEPTSESSPDQHADDLHRIIEAADLGAVDMFANSGGATNALALVAKHPTDVRTLVAHEPPNAEVLPDHENAQAVCRDIRDTYVRDGFGPAMAKFIGLVSFEGPIPDDYLDRPAPDPAMFGLPTQDDGNRTDPLLNHNIVSGNTYPYDFGALRAAPTRIVLAVGATSGEILPARGARAVAERLGTEVVVFPGGHNAFLGGEYGQVGEPDAFAAKLREVLDEAGVAVGAGARGAAEG